MTIKTIRARLDRLERSTKTTETKEEEKGPRFNFPIDPEVVQQLEDEYQFLEQVAEGAPEESQTHARIAALASTISCPPTYGFKEYWDDDQAFPTLPAHLRAFTLFFLPSKRPSSVERAQARARMEAYRQSPEGRARRRLDYLENGPVLLGPAEFEEMEQLIKLYPEPWAQPSWTNHVRWRLEQRGTFKDRKRRFERHQYLIKRRKEKGPKAPTSIGIHWQVKNYIEALRKNGCATF